MGIEWDRRIRSTDVPIGTPLDSWMGLLTMETNHSSEPVSATTGKKPYEKPSFQHEQVFVTTALACGKIPAHRLCHGNARAS